MKNRQVKWVFNETKDEDASVKRQNFLATTSPSFPCKASSGVVGEKNGEKGKNHPQNVTSLLTKDSTPLLPY